MIEFGKTLHDAREAKGFSIGQIAEITHMAPTTVHELETENFSRIAAPIYGRGFVKLYCETVGLDPRPLIAEFMELYNGTRDTDIKERPVAREAKPLPVQPAPVEQEPAPIAPSEPEPEPPTPASAFEPSLPIADEAPAKITAAEPPIQPSFSRNATAASAVPQPDLFQQEMPPTPSVAPRMTVPEPEPAPEPQTEAPLSRYAAPVRQMRPSADPRAVLRIGVLVVGALVLIGVLLVGLRAIYRATTPPVEAAASVETTEQVASEEKPNAKPVPEKPAETKPATAAPAAPAEGTAPRKVQKIPSLYID